MNKKTIISNLAEYCSYVLSAFSNVSGIYFRGQKNDKFELVPSLGRKINGVNKFRVEDERKIIEEAFNLLPNVFNKSYSPIQLLSLLQHYGVPTRLLDVTTNPLVALYFACENDADNNGEVIVFKEESISLSDYGLYNAIADSYELCVDNALPLEEFFARALIKPYLCTKKRNLERYAEGHNESGYIKALLEKKIFVSAPFIAERQRFQQGAYILFPNEISNTHNNSNVFVNQIKEIPKTDKCIVTTICIPSESKKSILKELKMFGIDSSRIYGDSIDSVCGSIKSKFEVN